MNHLLFIKLMFLYTLMELDHFHQRASAVLAVFLGDCSDSGVFHNWNRFIVGMMSK